MFASTTEDKCQVNLSYTTDLAIFQQISVGQFWRGSLGGGYITGIADNNEITGDNIAYIFPNLQGMLASTGPQCIIILGNS